jgi:hypothetical protein
MQSKCKSAGTPPRVGKKTYSTARYAASVRCTTFTWLERFDPDFRMEEASARYRAKAHSPVRLGPRVFLY